VLRKLLFIVEEVYMYKLGYMSTVPSSSIHSESARLTEKCVDHTRVFNSSRWVSFPYIFRPANTVCSDIHSRYEIKCMQVFTHSAPPFFPASTKTGTNWQILVTLPTLRSIGQSSWLQIQRSGFDFRRYQILWVVVGLERGPLSLVNIIEELLERKCSGSGLESI
jgi:hypothetical protein